MRQLPRALGKGAGSRERVRGWKANPPSGWGEEGQGSGGGFPQISSGKT